MVESRAIELYREYDSCRKVADELGVSDSAVRRVLIKHGIKRTGNRPPAARKTKTGKRLPSNCHSKYCGALVVMLRKCLDMPTCEIVAATGYPTNAVVNIIDRKCPELKKAPRQKKTDAMISAIEREYETGASAREVADKFGLSTGCVNSLMRKRGHVRGRGGGAVKQINETRRATAIAKIAAEVGDDCDLSMLTHDEKRELLMSSRRRDYGITWKSLARRNGSMRCEVCGVECDPDDKSWGSSGPTHPSVDHIVRICDGGEDTWDNVRLVCMECNLKLNAAANRSHAEVCI